MRWYHQIGTCIDEEEFAFGRDLSVNHNSRAISISLWKWGRWRWQYRFIYFQMTIGFYPVLGNKLMNHSLEKISLNLFMKIQKEESRCPDTTNILLLIGKIVHLKVNSRSVQSLNLRRKPSSRLLEGCSLRNLPKKITLIDKIRIMQNFECKK